MTQQINLLRISEDEINQQIQELESDEAEVDKELQTLLSRQCHLEAKMKSITKVLPNLEMVLADSKQLSEMIRFTSTLAENISGKVRKLDTARSRVSECQQRVHDLLDLQLCSEGVQTSLNSEDFETAAAHIHRYLSMDQRLLQKTADDMKQDCTSVSKSLSLLLDASSKLREIITIKFNEAVQKEDAASVERFFKLFPLIGMHDYGLEKFATYLSKKVELASRKSLRTALETSSSDKRANVIFADAFTLLFEEVAHIIEVHQPLLETYYGPGKLLLLVTYLQSECDKQSKLILSEMKRVRSLEKLTYLIRERSRSTSTTSSIQRPDPKDFDQLLGEITIIHSRYNLYLRFIRRKVTSDLEVGISEATERDKVAVKLEDSLKQWGECNVWLQELLGTYLSLEHYYMEESVKKAISMDTVDSSTHVSSMIDDVFFIVRKCIRRASGTGNIDGVCAVINNACGVLETEMVTTLHHSMRQGFPSGYLDLTQAYSAMVQGRLQHQGDSENARTIFLAHLNNTEVGAEYVGTLCGTLVEEVVCRNEVERGKLESCLAGLSGVSAGLGAAQELGLTQLRQAVVKPRIAPWLDSFLAISHSLSEEEFSSYEANEPFIRSLIGNLDSLLSEFKEALTPVNYDNLVAIVATEVSLQMEKVIMKTEFNRLGGLALDKEVRALVSYLSKATSWSVRDKFARLTQIATVLNLERVAEVADYWGTNALPWRLTPQDIKKIMKLRNDFRVEEINRLKL